MKLIIFLIPLFYLGLIIPVYSQNCTKSYTESSWGTCEEERDRQLQNFKNEATAYCKNSGGVNWAQTTYSTSQRGSGGLISCDFKGTITCNCQDPNDKDTLPPPPPPNPLGIKNSHEALSWLLKNSNNEVVKGICNTILVHWNPQKVIETGKIGFWWHNKEFVYFNSTSIGTDIVLCHANSNSNLVPNGPWEIQVQFGRCVPNNKAIIRSEFEKAGYKCIQDDGPNTGRGDKALAFEFIN